MENGHGYKHCNYFYNAILKYGWLNVHHEILRDNLTVEEANNLEKYYIKYYRSNDKRYGYNILEGGETKLYQNIVEPILLKLNMVGTKVKQY